MQQMTDTQQRYILHECAETGGDTGAGNVLALFEERVHTQPDADALVADPACLSYQALNARANQLAHFLRRLGVGAQTLVGLAVPRSIDMVIAMLGILKAGAAYLPLDPASPPARLASLLDDARPLLLLAQEPLPLESPIPLISLATAWPEIARQDTTNPGLSPAPQQLAYVIYTSGSTGHPKGVGISHQALYQHCQAWRQTCTLQRADRVLQFASPGFDVAAEEIFPTLASGATLHHWPGQQTLDLADFAHFLATERLSVLNLPASFWHAWVDELERSQPRPPDALRLVITGSEVVLQEKLATWQRLWGEQIAWRNAYGVTEATITSTLYAPQPAAAPTASVPLGRPLGRVEVYVLDAVGQMVPPATPGELYLGGQTLATGYLHRPDLTAERFVPHPFSREPGARLYRSGDRVLWRADGVLEYSGRTDDQVKLRGFRIELGEIEAMLLQHPAVHSARVIAHEVMPSNRSLVAFVVPRPQESALREREVHGFLKDRLPAHMLPAAIVLVPALPYLPNGKVDRQALLAAARELPRQADREQNAGPRTPVEEILAQIWTRVLGHTHFGIADDFFDLGGHSLLATQVLARLNRTFKVQMTLPTIFAARTIASLAEALVACEPRAGYVATIARLHQQISKLSPEEVSARLADNTGVEQDTRQERCS
ncbi:MAG TPA: non-ribosomal peptide synthetase [Ktedonobacteraceae bacterium]|jgi:amino acid adenylation domain-containing protein